MIVLDSRQRDARPSRASPTSRCRRCSASSRRRSRSSRTRRQEDQLFLARHDSDPFNRWQSLQDVAMALMVDAVGGKPWTRRRRSTPSPRRSRTRVTSEDARSRVQGHCLALPAEATDRPHHRQERRSRHDPRGAQRRCSRRSSGRIEAHARGDLPRDRTASAYAPDCRAGRAARAAQRRARACSSAAARPTARTLAREQYRDARPT